MRGHRSSRVLPADDNAVAEPPEPTPAALRTQLQLLRDATTKLQRKSVELDGLPAQFKALKQELSASRESEAHLQKLLARARGELAKARGELSTSTQIEPFPEVPAQAKQTTAIVEDAALAAAATAKPTDEDNHAVGNDSELLRDETSALPPKILERCRAWVDRSKSARDQFSKLQLSRSTESSWTMESWLRGFRLHEIVGKSLKATMPDGADEFEFAKQLTTQGISDLLVAGDGIASKLAPVIGGGLSALREQKAAGGYELNKKFVEDSDAKYEIVFGSLGTFYAGLEQLLGAPMLIQGDLGKTIEHEHCNLKDAEVEFTSSNGVGPTTSKVEYEFVVDPVIDGSKDYPQGVSSQRTPTKLEEFLSVAEETVNRQLVKENHEKVQSVEILAARLYSGPMYEKCACSHRDGFSAAPHPLSARCPPRLTVLSHLLLAQTMRCCAPSRRCPSSSTSGGLCATRICTRQRFTRSTRRS